ncbi:MAG: carboxypeptidase-like regulatory domain-containing protein [Bryobacterales bacterium]
MFRRVFLVLCTFSLFAIGGLAQQAGQIVGRVTDSSGAVVSGAAVNITEVATGFSRSTTTGEAGQYVFPNLRPAGYELTAEASGFRLYRRTGLELQVSQSLTLNIELQVGAVTETVDVVGNAIQVNTTTSELSEVVDQSRIVELPLNGRNVLQLTSLVTGTVVRSISGESAKAIPGGLELSANGTPGGQQTSYKLDGANNTDIYFQRSNSFPFPDALQEFSIQTSNYRPPRAATPAPW